MINRKKFIASFLAFSLVMLSVNLYAKERRGAELIIQRIGDQVRQVKKTRLEGTPWETSVITGIWGELIAVKQDSLLLLDAGGKNLSVDIADIKVITIVKKSKASLGAGLGLLICGGGAALYAYPRTPWEASSKEKFIWALLIGAIGGFAGLLIGGTAGAHVGTDETIYFEGMTDSEIEEALDKLRKKARIRDYK